MINALRRRTACFVVHFSGCRALTNHAFSDWAHKSRCRMGIRWARRSQRRMRDRRLCRGLQHVPMPDLPCQISSESVDSSPQPCLRLSLFTSFITPRPSHAVASPRMHERPAAQSNRPLHVVYRCSTQAYLSQTSYPAHLRCVSPLTKTPNRRAKKY